MKYEIYDDVVASSDQQIFEFTSRGVKGNIRKQVIFEKMPGLDIVNLVFWDKDGPGTGNDLAISNNGDRNLILATVASIISRYTIAFPSRVISMKGSTEARTRLYRMAINLNYEELSCKYRIRAFDQEGWEIKPFVPDMNVDSFLIQKK